MATRTAYARLAATVSILALTVAAPALAQTSTANTPVTAASVALPAGPSIPSGQPLELKLDEAVALACGTIAMCAQPTFSAPYRGLIYV